MDVDPPDMSLGSDKDSAAVLESSGGDAPSYDEMWQNAARKLSTSSSTQSQVAGSST